MLIIIIIMLIIIIIIMLIIIIIFIVVIIMQTDKVIASHLAHSRSHHDAVHTVPLFNFSKCAFNLSRVEREDWPMIDVQLHEVILTNDDNMMIVTIMTMTTTS